MQQNQQTQTQTTAVNQLEAFFTAPAAATNPQAIGPLQPPASDALFAFADIEIITSVGPLTWAQRKGAVQWQDQPIDWEALPGIIRSNIVTDVAEAAQLPLQYMVPFRHLGRVVTFALLPADRQPIRVDDATARPAPRATPVIYRDPPVPFLTLGLSSPETQAAHGRLVRTVLQDLPNAGSAISTEVVVGLLQAIARTGTATVSEILYFLTQLRALVSGSWRHLPENQGLLAVEHLVRQAVNPSPVLAQQVAHAHLVEGRPIEWGEADPLRVTVRQQR
ncbi:MAG: hypothetical protein Kow0031_28650 [Anaerolineae bacterium]